MALLDAVLDVVRHEYSQKEPVWKPSSVSSNDIEFLEKEFASPSEFDPYGWRKEMFQRYKKGKTTIDVRECVYGRVVAIGENKVLQGIPWGLWARILRLYGKKAKVYFLANPYLRTTPKNPKTPIGPPHINGGYTYACNMETIVIYRAEDATRVLLHELQHASCLDHAEKGTDMVEAETEAWAELLYAGLLSQGHKELFHELVQHQVDWMVSQNEQVKRHLRTERQFPWRYTVGKQAVWERWGLIQSSRPIHVKSLRLTPPPSTPLQRAFGVHSNIL